jgi:hypothetical protein
VLDIILLVEAHCTSELMDGHSSGSAQVTDRP